MTRWAWWRQRQDDDLDDEVRTHLEMATRDRIERGEAPAVAEHAARREFGNVVRVKEITREMWGWRSFERVIQDLGYGLRLMRRNPGFTATAVLSLALGIGANTAMFTVVNSVLLRPLPYRDPDRLVMVYSVGSMGPFRWSDGPFMDPDILAFRSLTAFSGTAAFSGGQAALNDAGEPVHVQRAHVTASLFPLLGVQPSLGRVFDDGEDAGAVPVVLLSDGLWRSRYAADPGVLGRIVRLEGVPHTIVGVMPPGFDFPAKAQAWVPLQLRPAYRSNASNKVVGRLADGLSLSQASRHVEALLQEIDKTLPSGQRTGGVSLIDLRESQVGKVRWLLLVLFGAVGCVSLIACANVASLLMARAGGRSREMSVRASLGASRSRLLGQLLTESAALAVYGGALGLAAAGMLLPILLLLVPPEMLPRSAEIRTDTSVLAFTFLLSLAIGLLFGILPSLSASRAEAAQFHELRSARGVTPAERRYRGSLVVLETALVLVLLAGAGLLFKSFWKLQHVDPGFRAEGLLTMTVSLPERAYQSIEQKRAFSTSMLERLQHHQLIDSAAAINLVPFGSMGWQGDFAVEGRDEADVNLLVAKPAVSDDYFRVVGIPLKRGRFFRGDDREGGQAVAIVSESVARACWPDRDPIGRRIRMDSTNRWLSVVGVVGDVHQSSLEARPTPSIYVPIGQEWRPFFLGSMTYIVRPRAAAGTAVHASLRDAVRAVDPELPIEHMAGLEVLLETSVAEQRFRTALLSAFALMALALAMVGIYGIVSFEVARRTGELGIRRALGARPADVLRLVIGRTAVLVGIGLAIGFPIARTAARALETFLFSVEPTDAATFLFVSAGLGAVALLAAWFPARRALSVDPITALKHE